MEFVLIDLVFHEITCPSFYNNNSNNNATTIITTLQQTIDFKLTDTVVHFAKLTL